MDNEIIFALGISFLVGAVLGALVTFVIGRQNDKAMDKAHERLAPLDDKLKQVESLVREFEKDRENKLGALGQELQNLTETSNLLTRTFSNSQERGRWGERAALDILSLLGFQEDVNYKIQASTKSGSRPDFTFLLPNNLYLNMDVKTPFSHYQEYANATSKAEQEVHRKKLLDAVRRDIKDTVGRGYINDDTVDMALIFIPSESVFRFIHEQDRAIIDDALSNRIVLCSPLTLYIVLALIWQATRNFNLEKHSRQILELLADIKNQWENYVKTMDTLDNHLNKATEAYGNLVGTRKRQLDKQFNRIDKLQEDVNTVETLEEQAAD